MALISKEKFTFDRVVRIGIALFILWAAYRLIDYLKDVLIPFAVAAIIAYLLNPLVVFLQKKLRIKKKALAIFISLFLTLLTLTLSVRIVFPIIGDEITQIGTQLNDLSKGIKSDQNIPVTVKEFFYNLSENESIKQFLEAKNWQDYAIETLKKVIPGIWKLFSGTLDLILGLFGTLVILLYVIFILIDYDKIMSDLQKVIPPAYKEHILGVIESFTSAMSKYFRAQGLVSVIMAILFSVGFSLINLPLGILIGIFTGLLNMIPYMQTLGFVPAAISAFGLSLQTGQGFWKIMALVLLVFAVVQIIQDTILNPKIIGEAVGLNPAEMLLSLSIWGKLLGFLGLLIALP
ncbi:AI-2E family transporter, partial [Xanthovirga aplysinae]|uniref:AI-2E family transporter n=1 Tax=Xanthovirga aplysinae TaxID=2529853 RepID=UPI0012BB9C7F